MRKKQMRSCGGRFPSLFERKLAIEWKCACLRPLLRAPRFAPFGTDLPQPSGIQRAAGATTWQTASTIYSKGLQIPP